MKRRALVAALVLAGSIVAPACMDWEAGVPCRTDLHCVDGQLCAPDGGCVPGTREEGTTTTRDAGPRDGGRHRG